MAEKNYRAELVGVFGDPVDGNPTGVIEEAAFAAAGLNWRYITCKVDAKDLGGAIRGMKAMNMRGVNLTMPHKIAVLEYLDELTEAAGIIGAVNTVVCREDGTLLGDNTDGKGFVRALDDERIDFAGKTVTMLGAGGAARSICVECALRGVKRIHIINRNTARGNDLAALIRGKTSADADYLPWNGAAAIPSDTDILINGTCVGLFPDIGACPDIDFGTVTKDMIVCDVVFNPVMPEFLKRAEAIGARVIPGIGMLVNQAAFNFELWTGKKADKRVMMDALVKEFQG